MKPEGRKSPVVDPANHGKLSVVMKQQTKSKSPVNLPNKHSKKSPVTQHLLLAVNTTTTRTRGMTRQSGSSRLVELPKSSANKNCPGRSSSLCLNIPVEESFSSYKTPVAASTRKRSAYSSLKPITPKIMITKCSKLEKLVEERELGKSKKVLRSKVKSPANSKVGKIGTKDVKETGGKSKTATLKLEDCVNQLKRKDSEILNLNRKINTIQKVVGEKEKVIKSLELKFPKMLADLKKGLNDEKKTNVELRETLRRNKQLTGDKKQSEHQLRMKDEKLKDIVAVKKKLAEELKVKDLELSDFRQRLATLEKNLPELLSQVENKEEEIGKLKETIEFLEQRLTSQSEDNNNQFEEIENLKTQLKEFSDEILDKENEIIDLRADNYELRSEVLEQYQNLEKTDLETKNYMKVIDDIRERIESGPMDVVGLHDSIDYLDKATEDFLDKVGAVSKERNMSFNLKLTVRKTTVGGSFTEQSSEDLGRCIWNPPSFENNNSTRISFYDSLRHSSRNSTNFSPKNLSHVSSRNSADFESGNSVRNRATGNVHNDSNTIGTMENSFDEVFDKYSNEAAGTSTAESSIASDASRDDVDVSSDTYLRLEELDNKVKSMWSKLSNREESFEEFKSDKKFSNSVSKLTEDLSESIQQHNKFLTQVNVAKKLFSSPTPSSKNVSTAQL
eukprot:GFUD01030546.1.p1 GENE.GFUD01030546.1~~GFUD01030546.1.p1  ORF type:complete len:675 (-),score=159.15 GFUD01030546.1:69-2093(-)